jgi:DNA-binding SARP family transcriptional activator
MAFDTETRGKLQRFVTEIRSLLTEDFTRQLQQTYGMDPASGEVAPVDSLKHLDDTRLETAHILREIMEHYLATEAKKDQAARTAVLERIARDDGGPRPSAGVIGQGHPVAGLPALSTGHQWRARRHRRDV